jgi:Tfp pilus assembly protein PilN
VKSVNLLPADLRGTEFSEPDRSSGGSGPAGVAVLTLLGALGVAVAIMVASVLSTNAVKQREADLADVNARQASTRQQVAALKPYADYRDLAKGRIATVRQLADSRFDWERAMRDVSRTLPQDVTLEVLDASLEPGDSEGASPLRGAIQSPAIQLSGCTRDQREVARMMARLRGVQGVTRVSLSESQTADDDQQKAGAPASESAGGTESPPCGPGEHPSFEVVIFFERDAALSGAPNVQSGAGAGAKAGSAPSPAATGSASSASTTAGSAP